MKSKNIIRSNIASLLLTSIATSFIIPGITTFATRTLGDTSESTSEKITREKKPKSKKPISTYADKKPVPAHILKQLEMFNINSVKQDKYYEELVKFLKAIEIKHGELNKGKNIRRFRIEKIFFDDVQSKIIVKLGIGKKEYQCNDIINWFLGKFTILNEEKFEVLLCAYMEAQGRLLLETNTVRDLVKIVYNEEISRGFYNKLYDIKNHYKVYSKEEILEKFEEFTQTDEYLNKTLLF